MGLFDPIADSEFLTHIPSSLFELASIMFFVAILVTINRLRSGFSATKCLLLVVLVFLFAMAVSSELRSLILQDLFTSFVGSLLTPFRGRFETVLSV